MISVPRLRKPKVLNTDGIELPLPDNKDELPGQSLGEEHGLPNRILKIEVLVKTFIKDF